MKKKALIIICSRIESKRIPEKCFKKIAGKPAIQHIIDRLKPTGIDICLAIPSDRKSVRYFEEIHGFDYHYQGQNESPLHRMAAAIDSAEKLAGIFYEYVVRVTHDDILIDAATVVDLVNASERERAGYAISPTIIEGAGVEVIARENLLHAANSTEQNVEHISYYVKGQDIPNPTILLMAPRGSIARKYRLTMDYPEDVLLLETVLRTLGPDASLDEVCKYLDQNPSLLRINKIPDVSIYTCVKNGERWISKTISSVCRNFFPSSEYIIVDDGSTDRTLHEILIKDVKLKLIINEENLGLASSSNLALSQCRGRYAMRVDADDLIDPDCLEVMTREAERTGAAIVYAGYREINEDGATTDYVEPDVNHHAGCALIDTKAINELRFKDGLRHWDGLELYTRVKHRFPISYIRKPLWSYRQHADSMSKSEPEKREVLKKEIGG